MMDFVWLDDRHGSPVVQLNDDDWSELDQELAFLSSKTGVWLDPYSTTRLAPDHAKLLVDAIRSAQHKSDNIGNLVSALDQSVATDRWMLAIGD
jgi:hypothetical protein